MRKKGWNNAQLAKATGLSPDTVGEFLAADGRWPHPATRGKIERALDMRDNALELISLGQMTVTEAMTPEGEEPVGAGLDPALAGRLSSLRPDELARVYAYIDGVIGGRQ